MQNILGRILVLDSSNVKYMSPMSAMRGSQELCRISMSLKWKLEVHILPSNSNSTNLPKRKVQGEKFANTLKTKEIFHSLFFSQQTVSEHVHVNSNFAVVMKH